ncbi:hypothetical protein BT96DRAFT_997922 [Gymnopus androsaceus JB14]|uniref:Zn(2)-C6 fungal-type domain-containing protein n=1 Tax=Gymnopus androsaceus JB14 TaxID=1447944 RepID=A0A6A4HDL2_9AGAR|nr:hypothetical protein BT96DRAFT_997922 [Gymnopus androsaceus JB14]
MDNKKRRSANSCDLCRKRKVRCDSATRPGNTCYNCLKACYLAIQVITNIRMQESIECTHTAQKKKRGPKPYRTTSGMGSSSIRSIINDVIAEPETYAVPEDPKAVRKILLDLAHYIRSLERQVSGWRQVATQLELSTINFESDASSDGADSDSDSSRPDTVEMDLTGTFTDLTLSNDGPDNMYHQRHFGKSSNMMLMKTAVLIKEEILGERLHIHSGNATRRMEFWTLHPWQREPTHLQRPLTFPEDDLLQSLCTLYFIHVHPYIPLIHQVQFERAMSEGLHLQDRRFGLVALGVCAVGSRFSNDPRNLVDGTSNEHSLGWRWYEQTSFLRGSFLEPPSLYDLQSCCLSALYLMGACISDSSMWAIVGLGIRLAQDMGLHRKKQRRPGPECPAAQRTVQSELCTRAFWKLPIECDEIYWETEDPEKAFVQPPGVPSRLSFFIFYCKLLEIAGYAQRALFSVNRSKFWKKIDNIPADWEQKAVIELDSALNDEYISEMGPEQGKQPFLPPIFNLAHCLLLGTAAGASSHLSLSCDLLQCCQVHHQNYRHSAPPSYAASHPFLSELRRSPAQLPSTYRLHDKSNPQTVNKDLQDVYRCLEIISSYGKRYQAAGRLYDILSSIISLGDQHFQPNKNGQGLFNSTPESRQREHSRSGETPTIHADGVDYSLMTAGFDPSVSYSDSSGNTPFSFDSTSFYGPADMGSNGTTFAEGSDEPTPSNVGSSSNLHSDLELFNLANLTDPQYWPMDSAPSGLASESGDDWTSFMAHVDEMLHSVGNDIEM